MLVCCGVRFLNNGICALISLSTKVFIEHFSVYVVWLSSIKQCHGRFKFQRIQFTEN